jgi:hypothetical protein
MTHSLRRRYGRAKTSHLPTVWSKWRDAYVGRVAGLTRWQIDPGSDGWILWATDRSGFVSKKLGVYATLEEAKEAAR